MQTSWRKRMSRAIRGQLRSTVLSNHGIGIVTSSRNGLLVVDPRDFGVSRSLLRSGSYDWPEVCWLSQLVTADSRLVFVGAHLGALLIPIALRSGARNIVAFEPSPQNHRLLRMNLVLNDLSAVVVQHAAAGDREGHVGFTQNDSNSGNSRVSSSEGITVPVTTLDSALPVDSMGIDLVVMDVEGFEAHAIRGGTRTLERTRYFYVEYAPDQLAEQGSTPAEFIDLVAAKFSSMYLRADTPRFFPAKTYVDYLRELPLRRGLLMNLLFSNNPTPYFGPHPNCDTIHTTCQIGVPSNFD
jgi:FkbM family methyltransferase